MQYYVTKLQYKKNHKMLGQASAEVDSYHTVMS